MSALRKDLRAITAEGAASSLMVGIGETYLPAFVLASCASEVASGLVATVPMLVGALLQLVSPYVVRRLRSYRRWAVLCAVAQAVAFVPLLAAAMGGKVPLAAIFVVASIYWAAGLAGGPAWNAWVGTLVPGIVRARYFAGRTLVSQAALVVGFVAGGLALQTGSRYGRPLGIFALLFLAAAASRLVSARLLAIQREPSPPGSELQTLAVGELLRAVRRNANARLLLYLLAAQTAVQISGPYFTPYMLGHLKLSYGGYVALICAAFLSKIALLPWLGRVADRIGPVRLLWAAGLLIVPLPALWLVSDSLWWLLGLQAVAGAVWGAYELAMLLLFFEAIPTSKRLSILTIFNVANAAAIMAGSLLGGALLAAIGGGRPGYGTLFVLSAVCRVAALALLVRVPRMASKGIRMVTRPVALRPSMGTIERPVLPSLERADSGPHISAEAAPVAASMPVVDLPDWQPAEVPVAAVEMVLPPS